MKLQLDLVLRQVNLARLADGEISSILASPFVSLASLDHLIRLEWRSADGVDERLPNLAAELLQLKVDVIFTQGTPATTAAKNATKTIPIVMTNVSDPVATGLVASLAHPGGKDPFKALDWSRLPTPKPDPFTEEERDKIVQHFRDKIRFYYPFVYTLFWTGMRPSEALALRWEDIDLKHGFISISKSRYMDAENSPKTAGSEREIRLLEEVVDVLKAVKPLHVGIDEHVFKNQEGELLNFHTWRGGVWYRILRSAGVRERKPYATRHTFISVGLTNGVKIKWLAEYCGTSVAMIEKHYGTYLGGRRG